MMWKLRQAMQDDAIRTARIHLVNRAEVFLREKFQPALSYRKFYKGFRDEARSRTPGALSIQPKIPEISVGTSNETDHFGLVRPEYSGPALKVVHFDRSGHFGRSDRNLRFRLTKLLSLVPLFCILLSRTITKRAVAWVGSVLRECTVPLGA